MFVALRDILHAKGRFALMIGVISLLTLLLVLLTGLTRGLGHQNTSAIRALPADSVVLTPTLGDEISWADSQVTQSQARAWEDTEGIEVEPLSVGQMRLETEDAATSFALFGIEPGGQLAAGLPHALEAGEMMLPETVVADLQVTAGDEVSVNGQELTVAGTVPVQWYSHSPVGLVPQETFRTLAHQGEDVAGSALLVRDQGAADGALDAAAEESATRVVSVGESLAALPSYSSENGSLTLIQGFLYGISALVTVAFLSVWTIQRTRDIAVLRALGASAGYVLRDTVGQAAILLAVGVALGGLVGAGGGAALSAVAPFESSARTVLLPVAGVLVIGLLGSILATRRVTRVDPLLALGGN